MVVLDGGALVEEGTSADQSPLVTVTFQRNVHRKEKYLEAEPKALGVLSVCMCEYLCTFLKN